MPTMSLTMQSKCLPGKRASMIDNCNQSQATLEAGECNVKLLADNIAIALVQHEHTPYGSSSGRS